MSSPVPRPSKLAQALVAIAAIVIAMLAVTGWQWFRWAAAGDSPYDEVGIGLNAYMPAPLHDWACGRIAQRFPGSLPPYGCRP